MLSTLSRICIGIILLGLGFIISVRLYRSYEERVAADQARQEEMAGVSSQFRSGGSTERQLPVFQRSSGPKQEIYLQETELPDDLNKEQARQTIQSILQDYKEDKALQAFYADLEQTTGASLDLSDLSGDNMLPLLVRYPQIQEVIARHSQDPAFAKILQEIFANPQFSRSVAVLQQPQRK